MWLGWKIWVGFRLYTHPTINVQIMAVLCGEHHLQAREVLHIFKIPVFVTQSIVSKKNQYQLQPLKCVERPSNETGQINFKGHNGVARITDKTITDCNPESLNSIKASRIAPEGD